MAKQATKVADLIPEVEAVYEDVPLPLPPPEPVVAPVIHCKDCKHWDRRWPQANTAECQLSRRYGPACTWTTDMTTCGQAERK
jgi:hypothetical protein